MKSVIAFIALCLPLVSVAQDLSDIDPATLDSVLQQVDPATIEAMMQQAQKIQVCMAKIDQAEVERVRVEADAKAAEIRALCGSGERAAAQSAAIVYGKQLVEEPVLLEAKTCLGIAGLAIPQTTWADLEDSETAQAHVCDL
jgi:hypothetical protein